jgi:quercetin dioxygenase-like cupin family protein
MAIVVKNLKKEGSLISGSDSKQVRSGLVVLEKGQEVGEHETGGGEELIVFLQGTAELSGGGETRTVHAPAVALVPAHTPHNVWNEAETTLEYVYAYVMAPDGA